MNRNREHMTWLDKIGFEVTGELRKPVLGEWYVNRNTDLLCFVYDESSLPCDCPKCGGGARRIVRPIKERY